MGLFSKKEKEIKEENKNARIKILGSGCSKCNEMEKNLKEALKNLNMDLEICHGTNFVDIAKYGVMQTPALVIDERVVDVGNVLSTSEIVEILKKELA